MNELNNVPGNTLPPARHLPKDPDVPLTSLQRAFLTQYIRNGLNASRAYSAIKPHVKNTTARADGSTLLAHPNVQHYLNLWLDGEEHATIATKADILRKFEQIGEKAFKKNKLQTSLNAYKEYGTLAGVYRDETDDQFKYQQVIQNLTITNTTISSVCNHTESDKEDKPID